MTRTALIFGAALLLSGPALAQDAPNTLMLDLRQPPSPELQEALAALINPSNVNPAFAREATQARPLSELCAETADRSFQAICSLYTSDQVEPRPAVAVLSQQQLDAFARQLNSRQPPGELVSPYDGSIVSTLSSPDGSIYALLPATSELARQNVLLEPPSRLSSGDGMLAIRLPSTTTAANVPLTSTKMATWPVGQNLIPTCDAAKEITTIASSDIEFDGSSRRAVSIERPDKLAEVAKLVEAEGGSVERVTTEQPGTAVEFAWPLRLELLSDTQACSTPLDSNWPFSAEAVATVLERDLDLLAAAGLTHDTRSRILVVDTGFDASITSNDQLSRFLDANRWELFVGGLLGQSTKLDTICADPNEVRNLGNAFGNAFGYVPALATPRESGICIQDNPLSHLVAPAAESAKDGAYESEHGTLVASVAVGGPALIERFKHLDRLIGLKMARIFRRDACGALRSDPEDVTGAFVYARKNDVNVINGSFRVPVIFNKLDFTSEFTALVEEFARPLDGRSIGQKLVVMAAGNAAGAMSTTDMMFPVTYVSNEVPDHIILVGGVQRTANGRSLEMYSKSTYHNRMVEIAAPAVNVPASAPGGKLACVTGTSIAAPQVTFTAAVLAALGYGSAPAIKARILATALKVDAFADKIQGGRVLDVAAALDIAADLIWVEGKVKRVVLRSFMDGDTRVYLCRGASDSPNVDNIPNALDARVLAYWSRLPNGEAEAWKVQENRINFRRGRCKPPTGKLAYFDLETGKEGAADYDKIDRIVPTSARLLLPIAEQRARFSMAYER
jgi:hypothetical protein